MLKPLIDLLAPLALAIAVSVPSTPARAAQKAPAKAAWTLVVYVDADNTLEAPQLANVNELLQVDSTDRVQMVILCDRSAQSEPKDRYSDAPIGGLPNWSGAKLLHVEKGRLKQLADWGDTNMADSATLRRFLAAAAKAYPADHYGLILADHGSGWESLCVDEGSGDQTMSLRKLREGLTEFTVENGKLDMIGLDACLMGSFETAQALAPVAHVMVGSEELAPGRGWNYDALAKTLVDKPAITGTELGSRIVDALTIHFNNSKDVLEKSSTLGVTLSVLDLDAFPSLEAAVAALGDSCSASLRNGRTGWIKVARPRAISEEYGEAGVHGEGGEAEMHDLMDLAQMFEASGDSALAEPAKRVDEAIRKVVRYFMRGPCRPRAGGISIYFPIAGIDIQDPIGAAYMSRTFARDCKWINFLSLYSVAVRDIAGEPHLMPLKATGKTASAEKPVEVFSKLTEADIDKTYFVMLAHNGTDLLMIGRLPTYPTPDGTLGQRLTGHWFMLSNGKEVHTCPITTFESLDNKHTKYLAYVPVRIRRANSPAWIRALCTFLVSSEGGPPHGQLLYAFTATKQGPLQVLLQSGDSIQPIYTRITPVGRVATWTADEKRALVLEHPEDFSMRWELVSKGHYSAGFEATNLAGLSTMELEEFDIE